MNKTWVVIFFMLSIKIFCSKGSSQFAVVSIVGSTLIIDCIATPNQNHDGLDNPHCLDAPILTWVNVPNALGT